jgi:alternative sigma factor RpoH
MPKKKRGSRPPENTQKNVQQSNQRRNFLLLGGGAIAAAGVGFAGYRAGWFASTKPGIEAPKPAIARKLPPVTLEPNYENALRSVNELTEYYARAIDNPYVLIHAVRGFGRNFTRTDGSNAVNRLCTAYAADKEVAGKRYVYFERINEVHDNSFLKTFLEAGVSNDQKLSVSGREYSLVDLGNSAKALFRFDPQNLKRFDPERGVRLVSFAVHWIRAEIHEFILRNWRIVKIATTKAQRKLFFNLRSMKPGLDTLGRNEVKTIAKKLGVNPEEVVEMETRLGGKDIALEPLGGDDGEEVYAPIAYLTDTDAEPGRILEHEQSARLKGEGLEQALASLDARSRRIIEARWLREGDHATLHDLAAEFGVSAERIRQIEGKAMQKMRGMIDAAAA